jgi:predicted transcriptional regulator of viral defense system
MKTDLLTPFERIPYFTIQGFRQAAGMEKPAQARLLLHRWVKAGHLLALKKGLYMTRHFYELHQRDEGLLPAVSAILLPHSYLSLEFVLQRHSLLTEVTYPVTAITPGNTRRVVNELGTFWYRSLHPDLYYGYQVLEYYGLRYAQATSAKALFDYLYLRPLAALARRRDFDLAEELRLNLGELALPERQEFQAHVEASRSRKMAAILDNLQRHAWQT